MDGLTRLHHSTTDCTTDWCNQKNARLARQDCIFTHIAPIAPMGKARQVSLPTDKQSRRFHSRPTPGRVRRGAMVQSDPKTHYRRSRRGDRAIRPLVQLRGASAFLVPGIVNRPCKRKRFPPMGDMPMVAEPSTGKLGRRVRSLASPSPNGKYPSASASMSSGRTNTDGSSMRFL